jgi:hypothetical protein
MSEDYAQPLHRGTGGGMYTRKIARFGCIPPSIICGCRRWPSAQAQSEISGPNHYRARNRKFESISLQRRVCELSVPEHRAINLRNNLLRHLAALTQHEFRIQFPPAESRVLWPADHAQVKPDRKHLERVSRALYAGGALRRSASPGRGRPEVEHIEARRQRLATFAALPAVVRYAKLAPGAVADEAAAVLDALAVERPITGRAA